MDKKSFFHTLSSTSLRALVPFIIAVVVVIFFGLNKRAFPTDIISQSKSSLEDSETSGIKDLIATTPLTLEKPSTLASNYPVPRLITERETRNHKMITRALAIPPNITRGNIHGTRIAVTFDGGIGAGQADEILDILKRRNIQTTVFLSGDFIRLHPRITRRIVAEGHEVGNHSTTHPHLTELEINGTQKTLPHVTRAFLVSELNIAETRFFAVTGKHMSPLWRAPYGEVNSELRAWAFSAGYLHIGWTYDRKKRASLDSLDWVDDKSSRLYHSPEEVKERILGFGDNGGHLGGGIILMHLGTDRGADRVSSILGEMLDDLIKKGLSVVKVSDLIGNKRLLREAGLKKTRYYQAKREADRETSSQHFKIHVRSMPLKG